VVVEQHVQDSDKAHDDGVNEDDEKHGGLVRKILETKKELQGNSITTSNEKSAVSALPKDKQAAEIEALRDSIQQLCRSTNPLGKTLDYIQEDVDGMNKELDYWKLEGGKWRSKMEDEIRITIDELSPLEIQLKQIEEKIEEQYQKISYNKGVMMSNEGNIQKLMRNIMHPQK